MAATKCNQCGLTNFSTNEYCKRCKASLAPAAASVSTFVPPPPPEYQVEDDDQPSRWRVSPLRILILILLVVGAVWYQISRDDAAQEAQNQNDKKFYEKRMAEDLQRHAGDRPR